MRFTVGLVAAFLVSGIALATATLAVATSADHWRACGTSPHSGRYFCTEYVGIPRHK